MASYFAIGSRVQCDVMQQLTGNSLFRLCKWGVREGGRPYGFLRDLAVTVGERLVFPKTLPKATIDSEEFQFRLLSLLPRENFHLTAFNPVGVKSEEITEIVKAAIQHSIPYTMGEIPLEGGNVHTFTDKGVKKAIVGKLTLSLTLAFWGDTVLTEMSEDPPSEEGIRLARNATIFKRYLSLIQEQELWRNDDIRHSFFSDVLHHEKTEYREEGRRWDFALRRAKCALAAHLEVDPKNLAIVPQRGWHIDMEILWAPNGTVGIHDEERMEGYSKQNGYIVDRGLFKIMRPWEAARVKKSRESVKKIGCKSVTFCGVIRHFNQHMNGVWLPIHNPKVFITFAGRDGKFQKQFEEQFNKAFPNYHVIFVEDAAQSYRNSNGGFRCLTLRVPVRKECSSLPLCRERRVFQHLLSLLTRREIKALACTSTRVKNAVRKWNKS